MKFDGNQAWKQTAAWVSANRDVLIALAGVFFLLPSLAVNLFAPQPASVTGMTPEQIVAVTRAYYLRSLPYIIPMLLFQALGILTILTLFTDRQRPTVGVAIRQSLSGILGYIVAQLLPGMAIGVVGGIIAFVIGIAAGSAGASLTGPLIILLIVAIVALAIYVFTRCSLTGPIIAVENVRNPIAALVRSWRLTRGNVVRMALFYVLLAILVVVILSVVTSLVGIIAALALDARNAALVSTVVSATLLAAVTVYFVAILGAAHRQLTGPAQADRSAVSG